MDSTVQRIFSHIYNLKQNVKLLLSNCFFKLENKVLQQVIGIPVGSDPTPFFFRICFSTIIRISGFRKTDTRRVRRF